MLIQATSSDEAIGQKTPIEEIGARSHGSSSPVLTATSLSSYGKAKNSTRHRTKTPDPIQIKFGMVDYVGEKTPSAKFQTNSHEGGFSVKG